jgi:hypothetical protein
LCTRRSAFLRKNSKETRSKIAQVYYLARITRHSRGASIVGKGCNKREIISWLIAVPYKYRIDEEL